PTEDGYRACVQFDVLISRCRISETSLVRGTEVVIPCNSINCRRARCIPAFEVLIFVISYRGGEFQVLVDKSLGNLRVHPTFIDRNTSILIVEECAVCEHIVSPEISSGLEFENSYLIAKVILTFYMIECALAVDSRATQPLCR